MPEEVLAVSRYDARQLYHTLSSVNMPLTPPSCLVRDHGRVYLRARPHNPHQHRAQRLFRAPHRSRPVRLPHRARVHLHLRILLPHHIHCLLSDPHVEQDVGWPPTTRRAGRAELPHLPSTRSSRHPDVWIRMVRASNTLLPSSLRPPPFTLSAATSSGDAGTHAVIDLFSLTYRIAFEIVALAAARLGPVPLAAQSIIMTADQSVCSTLTLFSLIQPIPIQKSSIPSRSALVRHFLLCFPRPCLMS
jgi:hypothetical protein